MIVVNASAALAALLSDGVARTQLADKQLHAPHLIDAEVASGLRRLAAARSLSDRDAKAALDALGRLAITRHPVFPYLDRVWELKATHSAYDAVYVGLAEGLGCGLLTADARLSRALGGRCSITVVPPT